MTARLLPAALIVLAGCSNAPVAGFLDCVSPSKPAKTGPPAGGVWATPAADGPPRDPFVRPDALPRRPTRAFRVRCHTRSQ